MKKSPYLGKTSNKTDKNTSPCLNRVYSFMYINSLPISWWLAFGTILLILFSNISEFYWWLTLPCSFIVDKSKTSIDSLKYLTFDSSSLTRMVGDVTENEGNADSTSRTYDFFIESHITIGSFTYKVTEVGNYAFRK